jgi:preprotein translocase subunit SecA
MGICPERGEERLNRFDRFAISLWGLLIPLIRPRSSGFQWVIQACGIHEARIKMMSDHDILAAARETGKRLRRFGYRPDLIASAFALIREVACRRLGTRHFDVQLVGGLILLKGLIAEMETGEGKTLTATLAAGTAALAGEPVHIITVNDYLAQRDAAWMNPVYDGIGVSVGTVVHGLAPEARRKAYTCDVTYCTNKEIAFDYLKDRITLWDRPGELRLQLERLCGEKSRARNLLMRGLRFAIIDEADSVLIDEARTPLIISSGEDRGGELALYREALNLADALAPERDFSIFPEERSLELSAEGKAKIDDHNWPETEGMWTSTEQRREVVRQALTAVHLFARDKDYLIKDGKVQIIDEFTGRVMADRSWEQGLHQLIEAKEGLEMTVRRETRARISYQRFFRRYLRLAGMTGTAREAAGELWAVYRLHVVPVPTNRPMKRRKLPDRFYATEESKWNAVVRAISDEIAAQAPVLVGTRSVAASERLSEMLNGAGLAHRVLNAKQDKEEAEIVARAGEACRITVATNMAGRGTDITLADRVAERGGLRVIATEFHESHRIDRQLFGRCGRQGDPGLCRAFASLEDELITIHGGKIFPRLARYVSIGKRGPINAWIGKELFRIAQASAERIHAKARKNLLKMDEQLGDVLAFSGRQE